MRRGRRAAVTGALDVAAVLARRDSFASHWNDSGQMKWLQGAKIELVRGHGRLAGEKRVEVKTPSGELVRLTARHAVALCTGSEAAIPPIAGLRQARPWTPREATSAKQVPGHLAIIGGGVVACEMASAWRAFGAQITVVEMEPRLLPTMEPFAGEWMAKAFMNRGIAVRTGVKVTEVRRAGTGGRATLTLSDGSSVAANEVLVAAGRKGKPRIWAWRP